MEFKVGDWLAITSTNELVQGDKRVRLEARAMDVLKLLHEKRGEVVTKDELIEAVWKLQVVSDHSITVVISNLRRVFGDDPRCPKYIETIPKRGYRLISPLAEELGQSADIVDAGPQSKPSLGARMNWRGASLIIAVAALFVFFALASVLPPKEPQRLVVLDTLNATNDPALDALAATITELTLDSLAQTEDIRLVRWRSESKNAADVDADSDDLILEAKLVAGERNTLLSVKLKRLSTDSIEWSTTQPVSSRYFRLAEANALKGLSSFLNLEAAFNTQPVFSAFAEELFWRARYLWSLRRQDEAHRARQLLLEVLEIEPQFARAHAALADLYTHKTGSFFQGDTDDPLAKARWHIEQAESIAPGTVYVEMAKAHYALFIEGDAEDAIVGLSRALKLAPNSATAWVSYANALASTGQITAAIEAIETAQSVDPMDASLRLDKIWILFLAQQYDGALDAAIAAEDLGISTALYQALNWSAAGRHGQALEAWLRFASNSGYNMPYVEEARQAAGSQQYLKAYGALAVQQAEASPIIAALLYSLAEEYEMAQSILMQMTGSNANWVKLWARRVPILKHAFMQVSGAL